MSERCSYSLKSTSPQMTAIVSSDTVQAAAFFPGNFDFLVTVC